MFAGLFQVICQVIDKVKLVLLFAAQYLTGRVKMTVIVISNGSLDSN